MINEFYQDFEDKKILLKKEIKKSGGNCARMLLVLAISTYGIGFMFVFILKLIKIILALSIRGSADSYNLLMISKDASNFLVGYLPCIIGDIIAIIIAIKTTKIRIKKDIFTRPKSTKAFILLGSVSCIGMGMVSGIIYSMYSLVLNMLRIKIPKPDFTFPNQTVYLILFLIYVCLVGPILEEIIFRGFILKSMKKYGNLTAIIISAILFSMFHLNLVQFVNPLLIGIIFGFMAIKSESIFPSMIAHIFNNTITFIMSGVSLIKMQLLGEIVSFAYILVGVIALIVFVNKYKEDFVETIKEDTIILKTYEKIKASFSGAWSIAYMCFYIIFIVGTIVLTNIIKIAK